MKIRTRFCPSPTGLMHLGNARTALFSALLAKANEGVFLLRIEDTDVIRSEDRYVSSLIEDLHWLGITWQEGPGVDGPYAPYWQSQRQELYAKFYAILEEKKLIYPCFCTDQELLLQKKLQQARKQAPRYAGTCKKLSAAEIEKRIAEGKKPAWRFSVPQNQSIKFDDFVKGPQEFQSNDIGDFIVRRADSTAPFLFCNAIDDATMHVSHVVRGGDHLANTPRQILILQALDLPLPHYGHLSLIVGDDGAKLSKRLGDVSVTGLRNQGFLGVAIVNYFARLGNNIDSQQLLDVDQLAKHFNVEKLSRSPARFDTTQLMYWQKVAVQQLDRQAEWKWMGESVAAVVPEAARDLFADTVKKNIEFPTEALEWAKIFFHDGVHIPEEELSVIKEAGEQFFVEAEQALDKYGIDLPQILADMKQTLGIGGKKLFMPLRIALTGKSHGPELANIAELLGQKKMKVRLSHAFKIASER